MPESTNGSRPAAERLPPFRQRFGAARSRPPLRPPRRGWLENLDLDRVPCLRSRRAAPAREGHRTCAHPEVALPRVIGHQQQLNGRPGRDHASRLSPAPRWACGERSRRPTSLIEAMLGESFGRACRNEGLRNIRWGDRRAAVVRHEANLAITKITMDRETSLVLFAHSDGWEGPFPLQTRPSLKPRWSHVHPLDGAPQCPLPALEVVSQRRGQVSVADQGAGQL